jgi:hypothetical protein
MTKPELRQFGDLRADDFRAHPIWAACHSFDYDEPWFDETDEETFRPWLGKLPADPSEGMFLVACKAILADGSSHDGFMTPSPEGDRSGESELGTTQPHLFLPAGTAVGFWGGLAGVPAGARSELYRGLDRSSDQVFPITFCAARNVVSGTADVSVGGFYRLESLKSRVVIRET